MEWPQVTVIVIWAIGFTTSAILHGSPNEVNVFVKITNIAIMASLLYLGGFWA